MLVKLIVVWSVILVFTLKHEKAKSKAIIIHWFNVLPLMLRTTLVNRDRVEHLRSFWLLWPNKNDFIAFLPFRKLSILWQRKKNHQLLRVWQHAKVFTRLWLNTQEYRGRVEHDFFFLTLRKNGWPDLNHWYLFGKVLR